jgi:beta-glucosidase
MKKFPEGFVWGTSTSSYQIEGGWLEGGKGLSIWDAFAHTPGKISDGANGDVASDHYHRFREDVALMARLGLKAYRLSLSWPRIQPTGYGQPSAEGIRFYSELFDELLSHGIQPWVTLYHWDLPLALQLEADGWLNPSIADRFAEYAGICFEKFGDRVKHWITLNEPWVMAILGYGQGFFAPGRVSREEPYQAAHHQLRAHALAVDLYRRKFQPRQQGMIGLVNNCDWREPRTDAPRDREAAQRSLEFFLGWFADPVHFGDYPGVMRARVGDRLPRFTSRETGLLQGSTDFFGLNHYTTMYAADLEPGRGRAIDPAGNGGIAEDQDVELTTDRSWEKTRMGWAIVPWGCRKLLHWVDDRYGRPDIILTENGAAFEDRLEGGEVRDPERVAFLRSYILECHRAIEENVRLKGYFLWSFMDNFEWAFGYSKRFGIHFVDYATGRRIPKTSARWYGEVIRNNGITDELS